MDLYREIILDHYKHPRNFGSLDAADARAEEHNTTCGDRIVMEIVVKRQRDNETERQRIIEDIRFSGEGCAISMASASLLTEHVKGKSFDEVMAITTEHIIDIIGTTLTPTRVKCAVLPLEVLQKAVGTVYTRAYGR